MMLRVAETKLEKDCSLTDKEQFLYQVYSHPKNKSDVDVLRAMTYEQIMTHKEALDAVSLIEEAVHKDFELQNKR